MRHFAVFAFALMFTTVLAHADVVKSTDDALRVEVNGADATFLLAKLQQQTEKNTADFMSCARGMDMSPSQCSFLSPQEVQAAVVPSKNCHPGIDFGPKVCDPMPVDPSKQFTNADVDQLLKLYSESKNLVMTPDMRNAGQVINVAKVDCTQPDLCSIQFELPKPVNRVGGIW